MAKLIVVYRLKAGVTAAAFETWMASVSSPGKDRLRRLEAFTRNTHDGALEYIEIYHVAEISSFEAGNLPAHVDACIMGEFDGLEGQPLIRVSDEPN
ncbi:MAG: hypothetical protein AAGJ32_07610 [Pseudomonadota bacterium]